MSSSEHGDGITRSSEGSLNWAADTDPVGPVTPELALVDPGLATGGDDDSEVSMSSMQIGDGTSSGATEPAPAPAEGLLHAPPPAVEPLPPFPPLQGPAERSSLAATPAETALEQEPGIPVSDMRDVPLGTLVFRAGLVPEERLEGALQEGMKTGKRLGEILLERGWVSESDLGRLIAGQKGLPFIELDPASVDPTAPPLLHPEKARLHGALPIGFQDGVPVVAVVDPSNELVVENVRRALACEPYFVVAGREAVFRAIGQAYPTTRPEVEPAPAAPAAPEAAVPTPESAPAPAPTPEPAAPVMTEPEVSVPPLTPELSAPVQTPSPVEVPPTTAPVVEPVPTESVPNGDGLWLGQQPPAPSEPAQQPAPELPTTAPVADAAAPPFDAGQPLADPMPTIAAEPVTPAPELPTTAPVAVAASPPFDAGQPLADPMPTIAPEPVTPPVAPPLVPPAFEPVAQAEAVSSEPFVPATAPEPEPERESGSTWSVVVRLTDGDRVEVGSYRSEAEARAAAGDVIQQASSGDGWPFLAGRFIRPDVIVSVDLLRQDRWLGSPGRAAWGSDPA